MRIKKRNFGLTITNTASFLTGLYFLVSITSFAQKKIKEPSPVALGTDGKLVYNPDSLGNRIVDFSYCGYQSGEASIPDVPVKVLVPLAEGDATLRIQAALDYVAGLPLDKNGFRGTVLLAKGKHTILGGLLIRQSGIILRGSGTGSDGTILFGDGKTRETVIRILGKNDKKVSEKILITNKYVPVNATSLAVVSSGSLKIGDQIQIQRPSTKEWISTLKMEEFGGETGWLGWKPGQRDLLWNRTITAIEGNQITIDVPITTALDQKYGVGTISKYNWPGKISRIGVENLSIESNYDQSNPKDEDHRWMGITMENVENAWIRQVNFRHLAGSAVALYETASKVTVEDCRSVEPVSEIGGQRRYTFFTQGQQTLFQRCYAENGYHDFAVGYCAPGPNAFVQCEAHLPFGFSGAIDSWASGVLFDNVNVDGNALSFKNRGQDGQGAGWTAANSVLWQCSASKVENFSPPGTRNFAFGIWAQFAGDGYWENVNEHVKPGSLYYAQLADRIGKSVLERSALMPREAEASSSPTIEQASKLSSESVNPAIQLSDWIDQAGKRNPILSAFSGKTIDEIAVKANDETRKLSPLSIRNGLLIRGDQLVTGNRQEVQWWRGSIRPHDVVAVKPHVTRFVPGRYGDGFTDDQEEMTDSLKLKNITVLDHNYGLWYDRRRDDHERIRRIDAEVWPPFYEQPFARSGEGAAWDNLSKYDLAKYNAWYWDRLQNFAKLADQKGLVLFHQNYFQHNILEAGAHYADFPWRPANNINNTGFPEPPPYAGDKRIFMAEQFYDISNQTRRDLHKAYIRKCLENFKEDGSVIQFISAEYTGPLHFVKFWLDVIAEWEKENNRNVLVALSTTKDVQDAILTDSAYSKIVDIIDIRYWNARPDGTFYAPEGGKNLAPRQHARIQKTGKISFESVYQSVLEYRKKYPDKAVLYSANGFDSNAWAVFFAGGSISAIPFITNAEFVKDASAMTPLETGKSVGKYVLSNPEKGMIQYQDLITEAVKVDLSSLKGNYILRKIDAKTGEFIGKQLKVKGGNVIDLQASSASAIVIWVSKK